MKTINVLFAAMAAFVAASCNKDVRMAVPEAEEPCAPISFKVDGLDVDFSTKVTPVTDMDSFNVIASTGGSGAETQSWAAVATKSGDKYVTDKYWPNSDPSYHFYGCNASMAFTATGATVASDSSADIVCAYKSTPTFNAPTTMVFHHILTRLGTVSLSSSAGYTVTVSSIGIKKLKTSGTYNLRTKVWSGTNEITLQAIQEGSNDMYFVPGQYDISVTFTLAKDDFSGTYTSVGTVDFPVEKICNLSIDVAKDPAVIVNFSVTVANWEPKSIPVTLL